MRAHKWVCPSCGRRFAKTNQWHSCEARDIETHFRGKSPELKSLFETLIQELKKRGPIHIDAVKTSINLISKHHFGGITVRHGYLRVGFLARKLIPSSRIVRTLPLGANRVAHAVIVRTRSDIDEELLEWLAEAQAMQS